MPLNVPLKRLYFMTVHKLGLRFQEIEFRGRIGPQHVSEAVLTASLIDLNPAGRTTAKRVLSLGTIYPSGKITIRAPWEC